MTRIGIDLGTTNVVAALADRGNYPVLELGRRGETRLSLPSVIAWQGDDLRVGWDALEVWDDPAFEVLASPKRMLGSTLPGPHVERGLLALLGQLGAALRRCPHVDGRSPIQVMVGVPANANSLQRYRTLDLMTRAGFEVLGLVHEPTAAALEYAERHPGFGRKRGKGPRHVAVYDLGGGTFDASVVRGDQDAFRVVASGGVEHLGGDDFDEIMARMAVGETWEGLSATARYRLVARCRDAKESMKPTTRRLLVDLEGLHPDLSDGAATVPVVDYHEACEPLVLRTLDVLERVLAAGDIDVSRIDALLLVGGGSQMPLVRRMLKQRVGSRVRISAHPFASTAIGLAVHAARHATQPVSERLGHHFGVWREADAGARPVFDSIFGPATPLPAPGAKLTATRSYQPAHNIGHFRYEECAQVQGAHPEGERTPWCDIFFPFDPALPPDAALAGDRVQRTDVYPFAVRERYECDAHGIITVHIEREEPPLARQYLLQGPEQVSTSRPASTMSQRES